jgi:hypothetical protein
MRPNNIRSNSTQTNGIRSVFERLDLFDAVDPAVHWGLHVLFVHIFLSVYQTFLQFIDFVQVRQ